MKRFKYSEAGAFLHFVGVDTVEVSATRFRADSRAVIKRAKLRNPTRA